LQKGVGMSKEKEYVSQEMLNKTSNILRNCSDKIHSILQEIDCEWHEYYGVDNEILWQDFVKLLKEASDTMIESLFDLLKTSNVQDGD